MKRIIILYLLIGSLLSCEPHKKKEVANTQYAKTVYIKNYTYPELT